MGAFVVVVSHMGIKRGHHCLVVLVGTLMLSTVVVELDMGLNCVASVKILLVVLVFNWVDHFTVYNLVMVVWSFVMDVIVHFVEVGWLMVGHVVIMVHRLNVMDMHIVVVEVMMVKMLIETVV